MTAGLPTIGGINRVYQAISQSLGRNRGTFANKPATPTTGQTYFATDLGSGIWIVYNGSKWKPLEGVATIYQSGAYASGAGVASETNYLAVPIPAGILSATGGLRIVSTMNCTGTMGGKTVSVRHNTTSAAVSGGSQIINTNFGGSSATLSATFIKDLFNLGATNSQVFTNTGIATYGGSSSTGMSTGSIDTAVISYINFNITGNAADTVGFQGTRIEWIEN